MAPAAALRDSKQATLTRDNLAVVAAHGALSTTVATRANNLPTPPNSLSPGLAAHGLKAQLQKAWLAEPDSDLDLHDASSQASGSKRSISPAYDGASAITTSLLARRYLPEILLNTGPLAIRHIIGCLTTSVPGFSNIPPAKARRLVVGALEGKCGEGFKGEVEFRKVGWGRWDARQRSGSSRRRDASPTDGNLAIPISSMAHWREMKKLRARGKGADSPEMDSYRFSHDEGISMDMPDPADNMSMDEYESASCSSAPDDDAMIDDDDPDQQTDDEDWAAIGAAGLRAESYNGARSEADRMLSLGSSGMARPPQFLGLSRLSASFQPGKEEQEAADALMRLASV
ncbi:hypothetical protein N3K66_001518 [Trichothecium roseum]|uniref:Uncharacterized protein n=1 Tax=Trichothecium roseum TaxID=47278 RepID=A0ACC0VF02_9HYPO|nr:hypothetical protein N3K66_001518 [Trichothecium roseum]